MAPHGTENFQNVTALAGEFGISRLEAETVLQQNAWRMDNARTQLRNAGYTYKGPQPAGLIANQPHNTTTGAKTAEELDMERAIALSLQDGGSGGVGAGADAVDPKEDPELAEALALSRQTSQGVGAGNMPAVVDLTGETNDELQATLLASIQTAQGRAPIVTNDPTTLERVGGLPVGLKNVGNTCYLNSLIQTYFMIPILRKAVISYAPSVAVDDSNPNHVFMLELQKLFCAMVLSNQRFVDPSNLLKKIVDDQGKPVNIGAQEDVSEFNDIFMTRLTKGLDLVHPPALSASGSQPAPNPLAASVNSNLDQTILTNGRLQRMFLPSVLEIVKSQEPDGTPIEQTTPIDFGRNFILPVNEETDLFTSLDKFMSDDVADWETPKGNKAPATRWKWLRHTPEMLFFQEQRAVWHGDSHVKANHKLQFPERLYMDRYHHDNQTPVTETRAQNAHRIARLAELQKQIDPFLNFEGGVTLDQTLNGTIKYLEILSSTKPGSEEIDLVRRSVDLLKKQQAYEATHLQGLQSEKKGLEAQVDQSYAHLNSEAYKLFAVWVHAGAAVGGHYWAYIRDPVSDEWYKLNDTDSSRVELPKVLEDGFGGQGVTSAYFLIYMKDSLYERCKPIADKAEGMPQAIRTSLESSNAEFDKKLKEHRENGVDGQMERFVTSYNNKITQTHDYATKFTVEKDMRYYSVFAFLLSIGMEEEMTAAVCSEMWLRTFKTGIGKSQNSPAFERLLTQQVPGTTVLFRAVSLNENDTDKKLVTEYTANHHAFRAVFMFVQNGLRLLVKPNDGLGGLTPKQDALRHFYLAYLRNEEIKFEIAKRRDLEDLVILSLILCLDLAIEVVSSHLATSLAILDDVIYVSLRLPFIGESIRASILDATLTTLPEKNPAFADEPRATALQERLMMQEIPVDKRWATYAIPQMPSELDEWEKLILSARDVYEDLKRKYTGFLAKYGLPELRIFMPTSSVSNQLQQSRQMDATPMIAPPEGSFQPLQSATENLNAPQGSGAGVDQGAGARSVEHMQVDVPSGGPLEGSRSNDGGAAKQPSTSGMDVD